MGKNIIDQYSLLHFASGIIAYFWGINLKWWIIIHILFEYFENTQIGMNIINTYFEYIWPGGKPFADSIINSISDSCFAIIGWLVAYYIDYKGNEMGLYGPHINHNIYNTNAR